MRLAGEGYLVTGAASGIGKAVAQRLLELGARVVGCDLASGTIAAPRYEHLECDVREESAVQRVVTAAAGSLGRIDGLVHAAGTFSAGKPIWETSLEDWDRVVATNLTGTFLVGREVARHMVRNGQGRIVNVACIRSVVFRPGMAEYAASKGGVAALTSAMALDLAPHGVQVNAIAPGFTWTGMTERSFSKPDVRAASEQLIPAGRIAQPDDVAGPAVFLLSQDAGYVTGEILFVDGGYSRSK